MRIEPLEAPFGACVDDVDLRDLDDTAFEAIRRAWYEHALLVFPGQHLDRDEQDAFAQRFGDLEFAATPLTNIRSDGSLRDPDHDLSKSLRGNEGWHHDSTYMPVQALGAVFTAEIVPSCGGATGFADMRAAYETLDADTQARVGDLSAFHSRRYSMERAGHHVSPKAAGGYELYGYDQVEVPLRPLVKLHPATGRPNLVVGQHAHGVPGLDPDESTALLERLDEHATTTERTHHHRWTVGDALLWDNLRLMHRATPHDPTEPRRMWHTRIAGDPATETAVNLG